ncbi:MAG TPA: hypothetical protein VGH37_02190 [Candidatus Acidoferrum sp.]
MKPTISARTLALVIAGFFLISFRIAAQTTQEPSIADAARMNRGQKKASTQPAKVITNDSFNPTSSSSEPSRASTPQPVQAPVASSDASTASAQPALSPEDAEKLKSEIAGLKQQLKEQQGEVELLKHLLQLDKESYYSKTDYARDTEGKAKLDSEQDELKQKEEEFAKLKAKLEGIAPQEAANSAPPKP